MMLKQKRLLYFNKLNRTITYKIYTDCTYICLGETFILEDKLYRDNITNICTYYTNLKSLPCTIIRLKHYNFATTILTTICCIYPKTKSLCPKDINNFCFLNDIIMHNNAPFYIFKGNN